MPSAPDTESADTDTMAAAVYRTLQRREPAAVADLASALEAPYRTIDAALRRLRDAGRVTRPRILSI